MHIPHISVHAQKSSDLQTVPFYSIFQYELTMIPLKAVLARASTSWDGGPGAELNITVAEKVPVVGDGSPWLWVSRSSSTPLRADSWASSGTLNSLGPAPVRGGSAPWGSGAGRDWGVSARL